MIAQVAQTPTTGNIAPHILFIAVLLSIGWGIYLVYTASAYRQARTESGRRSGDAVASLRRMVVAFCVFMLPFSFVIRTALVLMGFGGDVVGQVVFFSLVGTNIPGVIFVLVSLRYD